jgi:hypothetical protein
VTAAAKSILFSMAYSVSFFGKLVIADEGMASTAPRRGMFRRAGRQQATKSVLFWALARQVQPNCRGKKPRRKKKGIRGTPRIPFQTDVTTH